mmetsp:Transcript_126422/g.357561  ORF Transcript_126422/g.357561 Transcript_126422/m.357561 type:complete len:364 (+) Transcript_126422:308-1399(+)
MGLRRPARPRQRPVLPLHDGGPRLGDLLLELLHVVAHAPALPARGLLGHAGDVGARSLQRAGGGVVLAGGAALARQHPLRLGNDRAPLLRGVPAPPLLLAAGPGRGLRAPAAPRRWRPLRVFPALRVGDVVADARHQRVVGWPMLNAAAGPEEPPQLGDVADTGRALHVDSGREEREGLRAVLDHARQLLRELFVEVDRLLAPEHDDVLQVRHAGRRPDLVEALAQGAQGLALQLDVVPLLVHVAEALTQGCGLQCLLPLHVGEVPAQVGNRALASAEIAPQPREFGPGILQEGLHVQGVQWLRRSILRDCSGRRSVCPVTSRQRLRLRRPLRRRRRRRCLRYLLDRHFHGRPMLPGGKRLDA